MKEITLAELKANLRAEIRARRAAMTVEARREESAVIVQALCRKLEESWLPEFPGEPIAIYMATEQEANIDALAEWLWERDVPVLAPRVDLREQVLTFHPLRALEDAMEGPWRVRQPPAEESTVPRLVLVPGIAFDLQGGRLGTGGGWYDRSLKPESQTIGVCFGCQIVERVPREPHDLEMGDVVFSPLAPA